MNRPTILASLLALLVSWSIAAEFAQSQTPSAVGQWNLGPLWDIAPVHTVMLPNGKVMLWPGDYVSGDDPRLWDPTNNTLTSLPKAGYDLFCSGHIPLADGTMAGSANSVFCDYPVPHLSGHIQPIWGDTIG